MTMANSTVVALAIAALLTACAGAPSQQPIDAGSGPDPQLPPPESKTIPLVNIAPAKGWSGDQKPTAAAGMAVASYAADLALNHDDRSDVDAGLFAWQWATAI